jgi:putative ABC transport system permease protein
MLANFLTFVLRILNKNKFYSLLNLAGLAVGFACGLLILLYLQDELTYDKHHVKHPRIYRIASQFYIGGNQYAVTSPVLGPMLQEAYPGEIEQVVRFQGPYPHMLIQSGEKQFYEDNIYFADSTVFEVFTHSFLQGDPKSSLRGKNSLVLTEKLAKRYFGTANPLNQFLEVNGTLTKITGVIKDVPGNSHLSFDALLSYSNLPQPLAQERINQLWSISDYTYILVPSARSISTLSRHFPAFYNRYMAESGINMGDKFSPLFEPLTGIHLGDAHLIADRPPGNRPYLYAFSAIGVFILVLAAINYINLATARGASRSREVGVKKVLGATQRQLMTQFLGEALVLSLLALLASFGLVLFVLKLTPFNELVQKQLCFNLLDNPFLLAISLGITGLIGLLSGFYPALYLSNIPTATALKGAVKTGLSGLLLRKALVTFQFAISIGIFICALLMEEQIDYLRNKNLGFQKENVLLVDLQDSVMAKQTKYLKSELLKNPNVLAITTATTVPGHPMGVTALKVEGQRGPVSMVFNEMLVGKDYLKTMGLLLVQGQDFDQTRPTDQRSAVLINQALARKLGWSQPLNKKIGEKRVIGVVKDFHTHSLHKPIAPVVINLSATNEGKLHLRLSGKNLPQTLRFIENKWAELGSDRPFEFRFLDESLNQLYSADERQSHLIGGLTAICTFISLLGVLGLSSYTVAQRTKEMGIRKVLGASVSKLVYLMVKEVMGLVLIASVVASPLAYYLTRKWLQDFAYQVSITPLIFILSSLLALLFTFLAVGFQTIRAAQANPVNSLKHE